MKILCCLALACGLSAQDATTVKEVENKGFLPKEFQDEKKLDEIIKIWGELNALEKLKANNDSLALPLPADSNDKKIHELFTQASKVLGLTIKEYEPYDRFFLTIKESKLSEDSKMFLLLISERCKMLSSRFNNYRMMTRCIMPMEMIGIEKSYEKLEKQIDVLISLKKTKDIPKKSIEKQVTVMQEQMEKTFFLSYVDFHSSGRYKNEMAFALMQKKPKTKDMTLYEHVIKYLKAKKEKEEDTKEIDKLLKSINSFKTISVKLKKLVVLIERTP